MSAQKESSQDRQRYTGFTIAELIIILATLGLVVAVAVLAITNIKQQAGSKADTAQATQPEDPGDARDKIRKDHALTLATRLFYASALQKRSIERSQQGFDSFSQSRDGEPLLDPLTHKPYVFNKDQAAMKPGEVTFGVDATCDNKISGSDGTGMIIKASAGSEAVALKLESDSFACEASGI